MNYQECLVYLHEAEKYGSVLGLDSVKELCRRLGDPQKQCKVVHVAGTNGKGSVMAYLYAVLIQSGKKVGRYTSPALFSYLERWEINGRQISEESFASLASQVAEKADQMAQEGLPHPTPFELETALAFLYFAKEQCEVVLLEVGMGGDLDATNIVEKPLLSILTSISMDHMAFLGNTLGEIATKKAGILKKGSQMISAKQEPEARSAIIEKCRQCGLSFHEVIPEEGTILREGPEGQEFMYHGGTYEIPLLGVHQKENAILALEALNLLEKDGIKTSWQDRIEGLRHTVWRGRFTILHREPLLIADGAHNPGAAEVLGQSLERYFPDKKLIMIIGMFRDKDYHAVLKRICPKARQVFAIETPDNPRALPREELAAAAGKYCDAVETRDTIDQAVQSAFLMAEPEDIILAFGSLSFMGRLQDAVNRQGRKEESCCLKQRESNRGEL